MNIFGAQTLKNNANDADISSLAISNGNTITTKPVSIKRSAGHAGLWLLTTGSVTVTWKTSFDDQLAGASFLSPCNVHLQDLGALPSAVTSDKNIVIPVTPGYWVQFYLLANTDITVTAKFGNLLNE